MRASQNNPKLSALWALYESDPSDKRALRWVVTVMKDEGGNIEATAEKLGVARQTLYKWFKKYPELQTAKDKVLYEEQESRKRVAG